MLDTVKNWIAGYCGGGITVDYVDSAAPSLGLFSKGCEQIQRTDDILGNSTGRFRWHFTLKRVVPGYGSQEEAARWAMDFQQWILGQTQYPQLGENTRWYAENGRLQSVSKAGTCLYTVALIGEFTRKQMEETNEN